MENDFDRPERATAAYEPGMDRNVAKAALNKSNELPSAVQYMGASADRVLSLAQQLDERLRTVSRQVPTGSTGAQDRRGFETEAANAIANHTATLDTAVEVLQGIMERLEV